MTFARNLGSLLVSFALVSFNPMPAFAGPAADALGQCMVGKTAGDERILMVRWMTLAFASHPAVKDAITIDTGKMDLANRDVAKLVTDLLVNRCGEETKAAVSETNDPGIAMQTAFQALGGAAAREVMTAPEVSAAISGFSNYLDKDALTPVLQPK